MRWNPSRQEWVTYSEGRVRRTSFPPKKYCPFCPAGKINFPTEIPFKNFDIAVFPNRWASFKTHNNNYDVAGIETKPSNGIWIMKIGGEKSKIKHINKKDLGKIFR